MYRIIESKNEKEIRYTVQKNRKWIIPWRWHNCKLEVFCGFGTMVYNAIFATRDEAEKYIKYNGAMVNGVIPGFLFYQH